MADIEKVNTGLKCLADVHDGNCAGCGYSEIAIYPVCVRQVSKDALSVIEELQAENERLKKENELIVENNKGLEEQRADFAMLIEKQRLQIERLCNKIGVMKESIEDAIMSETVFDTFDDLSSYVNAERCRSEEWTGGIRDAIQAVRAWGE